MSINLNANAPDMIDMSQAVHGGADSPDVRQWSIIGNINRLHLSDRHEYERGNVNVWFPGRNELPANPKTSQGDIRYTMWMGLNRGGKWVIAPLVECILDYVPTGDLFAPNQVAQNLFYYRELNDLIEKNQPAHGEEVVFFCTTGNTRRQNVQQTGITPQRTNAIRVPFAPGDFRFVYDVPQPVDPEPKPVEPGQPVEPVDPTPQPGQPSNRDILDAVLRVEAKLAEVSTQVNSTWTQFMKDLPGIIRRAFGF